MDSTEERVARLEAVAADPWWLVFRAALYRAVQVAVAGVAALVSADGSARVLGRTYGSVGANLGLSPDGLYVVADPTAPSGGCELQVNPNGDVVARDFFGSPPTMSSRTISGRLFTDAQGWRVSYQSDGKRVWRKTLDAVTLPASTPWVLATVNWPVGVVALSQVRIFVGAHTPNGGYAITFGAQGATGTKFDVAAGTNTGAALSTYGASCTIYLTLEER